jgi:hypothetical protein
MRKRFVPTRRTTRISWLVPAVVIGIIAIRYVAASL